ncbi:hypothetical protein AgCh_027598 [Apium graveolens]
MAKCFIWTVIHLCRSLSEAPKESYRELEKELRKITKDEAISGQEFEKAEINYLGQMHPNLVKLVGYYLEEDHRLLVYMKKKEFLYVLWEGGDWGTLFRSSFGQAVDGSPNDIILTEEETKAFNLLTQDNGTSHSWDLIRETVLVERGLSPVPKQVAERIGEATKPKDLETTRMKRDGKVFKDPHLGDRFPEFLFQAKEGNEEGPSQPLLSYKEGWDAVVEAIQDEFPEILEQAPFPCPMNVPILGGVADKLADLIKEGTSASPVRAPSGSQVQGQKRKEPEFSSEEEESSSEEEADPIVKKARVEEPPKPASLKASEASEGSSEETSAETSEETSEGPTQETSEETSDIVSEESEPSKA